MHLSLEEHLLRLRRRLLAVGGSAALAWAAVAAIVLLLLCVWLDLILELSPGLRIGLSLAAVLGGALLLGLAWRTNMRRAVPQRLARRLDTLRETGGQILSGVDLMLHPIQPSHLTSGLAALAVDRAAALAEGVAPAKAVPVKPLTRAFGALLLLCAASAVLAALMPRLARTQWLRFTDPFGDHPPYSRIEFAIEPGSVRVTYGDGLDIRAAATGGAVDRVDLVLQLGREAGAQTVPMFPEPGGKWRATIASVVEPGQYYVRAHSARSHRYNLDVVTVPRLEGVRWRIAPPAYTGDPPFEGPLPASGLAGLPGTRVELWAKSNRPLSGGTLELPATTDALALAPVAGGATEVTGSFALRAPGQIRLKVIDVARQPSKEDFTASIVILPDQRPFVRILEPPAVSLATPNVGLPVAVSAEDDFGVSRLQLYRSLNDSRPLPVDLELPAGRAKRAQATTLLPLPQYGLQPGDVIKLFARVEDNDPAGPKGAESPIVQVRIISQEDFERLVRTRAGLETLLSKYQEAERRLENIAKQMQELQKELEGQPPDSELAARDRQRLAQLAEQMQQEAEEIQQAAEHELPYDIDKELSKQLAELAQKLAEAGRQTGDLAQRPGLKTGLTAKELEELRKKLGQQRQEFSAQALAPLEHLAAAFPLLQDAARFVELYQRQRELAERLAALKGHDHEDDPAIRARMRDLEAEQRELRAELSALLDDIESHVARLPDDPQFDELRDTATEFVDAVSTSGADEAMLAAETGLAEFSGTRGYEEAKKAADILETFIGKCQGVAQGAGQCLKFNPSLSACLGNTVEQLLADAGLGTGTGAGTGAGGGYSARRSSLQNVGLYGALPALGQAGLRGNASDRSAAARGPGDPGAPGLARQAEVLPVQTGRNLRAAGADSTSIPVRYRKRVADYFQRIADELGE